MLKQQRKRAFQLVSFQDLSVSAWDWPEHFYWHVLFARLTWIRSLELSPRWVHTFPLILSHSICQDWCGEIKAFPVFGIFLTNCLKSLFCLFGLPCVTFTNQILLNLWCFVCGCGGVGDWFPDPEVSDDGHTDNLVLHRIPGLGISKQLRS